MSTTVAQVSAGASSTSRGRTVDCLASHCGCLLTGEKGGHLGHLWVVSKVMSISLPAIKSPLSCRARSQSESRPYNIPYLGHCSVSTQGTPVCGHFG